MGQKTFMQSVERRRRRRVAGGTVLAAALCVLSPAAAYAASGFAAPAASELSMKELLGYPGVAAVVLERDVMDKGSTQQVEHYERIKVLTEDGKKYASIELPYITTSFWNDSPELNTKVIHLEARTIHADGTVIPFTDKPYVKTVVKVGGVKAQEKIFTLPDVQVGSIIEYRYTIQYGVYEAPDWILQGDLYVKAAHYHWAPTRTVLENGYGHEVKGVTFYPVLPKSAKLVTPKGEIDLTVTDVPPLVEEPAMPPKEMLTFRVMMNYTEYSSKAEYWKKEGDGWSKAEEPFLVSDGVLKSATAAVTSGATTDDAKLRRIYAAVMQLENTDLARERDARENKAAGLKQVEQASDVWKNRRGDSFQLTKLFVAMARAAGMKAYLVRATDRSRDVFTPDWMNIRQFDHLMAIVVLDGKDQFFDPGSKDCPYRSTAWQYTLTGGLRQTPDGTSAFVDLPAQPAIENHTMRQATLQMDEHGGVSGKIVLAMTGAEALRLRQAALQGDREELRSDLESHMKDALPKTLETTLEGIENLDDYEKPLRITFATQGAIGTMAGKRRLVPGDIFQSGEEVQFPEAKRTYAMYFSYPRLVEDAVEVKLTGKTVVDALPPALSEQVPKSAGYALKAATTPAGYMVQRQFAFVRVLVPVAEYPALRNFYTQVRDHDQESVVLKPAS